MGEVFKLKDLRLDRVVAAKVVRADRSPRRTSGMEGFLREARALALFSDRRIVQVFDFRPEATPPVIIMEFVDGFELGRIGPSLEFAQRARIMIEICEAIDHAHTLGLQHRDLKPSNIMLDAQLRPRILDSGRKGHKAVAVAFYLAAVALLPLFLLILFHETGLLVVAPGTPGQLFQGGSASNHQLQITILAACAWCGSLALRTRTAALSTVFAMLALLLTIAIISDFGLRAWIEEARWDRLALHLFPLVAVYAALGALAERTGRPWFSRPLYLGSAVLLVAVLELLALDGRAMHYLGLSLRAAVPRLGASPVVRTACLGHGADCRWPCGAPRGICPRSPGATAPIEPAVATYS